MALLDTAKAAGSALLHAGKLAWDKASRKFLYVALVWALEALRAKYPGMPLPPPELTRDLILALLAAHTGMDAIAVIGTFVTEYAKARAGYTVVVPGTDDKGSGL